MNVADVVGFVVGWKSHERKAIKILVDDDDLCLLLSRKTENRPQEKRRK